MDEPRKKKDSRMPLTRKNKDAIVMADRAEKMMSARHEEFTKEDVPSTPKIAETAEGIIKVREGRTRKCCEGEAGQRRKACMCRA